MKRAFSYFVIASFALCGVAATARAKEDYNAKAEGCHQIGVVSAYEHFTKKPNPSYAAAVDSMNEHPAWLEYSWRIEKKCMKSPGDVSPWAGAFMK
jgi:hypothetical protein